MRPGRQVSKPVIVKLISRLEQLRSLLAGHGWRGFRTYFRRLRYRNFHAGGRHVAGTAPGADAIAEYQPQ